MQNCKQLNTCGGDSRLVDFVLESKIENGFELHASGNPWKSQEIGAIERFVRDGNVAKRVLSRLIGNIKKRMFII